MYIYIYMFVPSGMPKEYSVFEDKVRPFVRPSDCLMLDAWQYYHFISVGLSSRVIFLSFIYLNCSRKIRYGFCLTFVRYVGSGFSKAPISGVWFFWGPRQGLGLVNWERHFLEISRSAIFNNLLCLIVGRSNWAFWEKNPQAHLTIIRE